MIKLLSKPSARWRRKKARRGIPAGLCVLFAQVIYDQIDGFVVHFLVELPAPEGIGGQQGRNIFCPVGIGVTPLPVDGAQVVVYDFVPVRGGHGNTLQKEFVGTPAAVELLSDELFPAQNICSQTMGDAEPLGAFVDGDDLRTTETKQFLQSHQSPAQLHDQTSENTAAVAGQFLQREVVADPFPEEPLLVGNGVEFHKFRAVVIPEESVDLVLGLQRKIYAGKQVVVPVISRNRGPEQIQLALDEAFAAPADAEPGDQRQFGVLRVNEIRRKGCGFAVDVQIDIIAGVIQQMDQLLELGEIVVGDDQIGVAKFRLFHMRPQFFFCASRILSAWS